MAVVFARAVVDLPRPANETPALALGVDASAAEKRILYRKAKKMQDQEPQRSHQSETHTANALHALSSPCQRLEYREEWRRWLLYMRLVRTQQI